MAAPFPPLDQIDPAEAWQPWRPSAADPWGRKWAAHLYRRAAFGPSRDDLARGRAPRPRRHPRPAAAAAGPTPQELAETLTDVGRVAAEARRRRRATPRLVAVRACSTAATRCARS